MHIIIFIQASLVIDDSTANGCGCSFHLAIELVPFENRIQQFCGSSAGGQGSVRRLKSENREADSKKVEDVAMLLHHISQGCPLFFVHAVSPHPFGVYVAV